MNRSRFYWCKDHKTSLAGDLEYYVHVADHRDCHVQPIAANDARIVRRIPGKKGLSIIDRAIADYKTAEQDRKAAARGRKYYSPR